MSFNADTQKSFIYLQEVEEVAQEILTDKQTKLELVNAENKTREAYRALQNIEDRQAFLKVGEIYIQLPKQDCRELLKDEIDLIENELEELQGRLRGNLGKLRDLEHEPRLEGMGLKAMSVAEARCLNKAFGGV